MCQLTLTDTGVTFLNRSLLYILSRRNSKLNGDGFGFFTPKSGIFKTELAAYNVTNLGEVIRNNVVNADPVLSHVRKATFTENTKNLTRDKAHPFETEKLVLAHNGQLTLKKYEAPDGLIDSEIFLKKLDAIYVDKLKLSEAIKKTMELFEGKFAFIIFDKRTKSYYVVRGDSANLHYFEFPQGGIVVNTEKDTLVESLVEFNNFVQLIGWKDWDRTLIKTAEIKEVPKESILILNKERRLAKICDIKENRKPVTYFQNGRYQDWNGWQGGWKDRSSQLDHWQKCLQDFTREFGIGLIYLDRLLYLATGNCLLECTQDDIKYFVDKVVPELRKRTRKHVIKEWKKIVELLPESLDEIGVHIMYNFKFPYMLNSWEVMRDVRVILENDQEEIIVNAKEVIDG